MYIDRPWVRELIEAGTLSVLPTSVSQEIERVLMTAFPTKAWGSGIDWAQIPGNVTCNWMELKNEEVLDWAMATTAGTHSRGVMFYNSDEPCLYGDFAEVVGNLDALVAGAPGPRLIFGADRVAEERPIISRDVIEYNGVDKLFGVREER
jgi:hypothetical protein